MARDTYVYTSASHPQCFAFKDQDFDAMHKNKGNEALLSFFPPWQPPNPAQWVKGLVRDMRDPDSKPHSAWFGAGIATLPKDA